MGDQQEGVTNQQINPPDKTPKKPPPIDPSKLTGDQIADDIEHGLLPADTPGANWDVGVSTDDVDDKFATRANGLNVPDKQPASVVLENWSNATFANMYQAFQNATVNVGSAQSDQWASIGTAILE